MSPAQTTTKNLTRTVAIRFPRSKMISELLDFGVRTQNRNYEQYEGAQWHVYYEADFERLLLKICIATFGVPENKEVLEKLGIPSLENEPTEENQGNAETKMITDVGSDCEIDETAELIDSEIERLIFDSDYGSEDEDQLEEPQCEHEDMEEQNLLPVLAEPEHPNPSPDDDNDPSALLAVYSDEQRKEAEMIRNKIIEVHRLSKRRHLRMFIIFVVCSGQKGEYTVPVYRVATKKDDEFSCKYVDITGRIYSSWTDWTENNKMPAGLRYCYPKFGYYTDDEQGGYSFSKDTSPLLVTELSPSSSQLAKWGRNLDNAAGITGFVASGVAIASVFTPLAPIVLGSSAVAGLTSAFYGAGRSANRLHDKGTHGESLKDFESAVCWGSIALTPLSLATGAMGSRLVQGATQEGRIFSNTFRGFFNVVNATSLTMQFGMTGLGFANLVDKYNKNQLTKLDVLQFSMSLFLFSNTLIQPKTAAGIISKAQDQHFENYRGQLNSEEAKAGFDKLLTQNGADGDITAKSKVVRNINKVQNPEQFYESASKFDNVKIGGRKGRTVVLSQEGGKDTRVNVSRTVFTDKTSSRFTTNNTNISSNFFNENSKNYSKGASKQFNRTMNAANEKFGRGFKDAVKTMATELGAEGPTQFQAVAELIAIELKGLSGDAVSSRLHQLQTTDKNSFVRAFQRDLVVVSKANKSSEVPFKCDWQALYHFRKHGQEFSGTPTVDVYFQKVPRQLFKNRCPVEVRTVDSGVQKIYSMPDGKFAVIHEDFSGNVSLSTIHNNKKYALDYVNILKEMTTIDCSRFTFNSICQRLAVFFGHTTLTVTAHLPDGTTGSINNLRDGDIDPNHHEYVIRALCALGRSYH